LTVGPWRPIYLHSYHTRISDLHISALVNESLDADLIVRIALSPSETWSTAEVTLKDPAGSESSFVASQSNIILDNGAVRVAFHFKNGEVKLWYPVGYGEQPLYEVQVGIYDDVRSLLIVKELLAEVIGCSEANYWIARLKRLGSVACASWRTSWSINPDSLGSLK